MENVPRHVDHAWLEKIFLSFGPISYISLPKFRRSGEPKGFAFVEFERKESALGCLEAYQGQGAILPGDMDPGKLMSVQTFNEEQELNRKGGGVTPGSKSQQGEYAFIYMRQKLIELFYELLNFRKIASSRSGKS